MAIPVGFGLEGDGTIKKTARVPDRVTPATISQIEQIFEAGDTLLESLLDRLLDKVARTYLGRPASYQLQAGVLATLSYGNGSPWSVSI